MGNAALPIGQGAINRGGPVRLVIEVTIHSYLFGPVQGYPWYVRYVRVTGDTCVVVSDVVAGGASLLAYPSDFG